MRRWLPVLLLVLTACAGRSACCPPVGIDPTPLARVSWHALGSEQHRHADARLAQREPLRFTPWPRWFGSSDWTPPRATVPSDVPVMDRQARMTLTVADRTPEEPVVLTLTVHAGDRPLYREIEHRWTNTLPFLFAIRTERGYVRATFDGAAKFGGTVDFVQVVEARASTTWRVELAPDAFDEVVGGQRPQRMHLTAAFCERQHGEFAVDPEYLRPMLDERREHPFEGDPILVRSDEVTIVLQPQR